MLNNYGVQVSKISKQQIEDIRMKQNSNYSNSVAVYDGERKKK